MNKELKAKWVAALHSGDYEQAKGALRTETGFCCLGILCEVAQFPEWDGMRCGGLNESIPKYICDRINLPYGSFKTPCDDNLMEMNDEGKSFTEIANYIERNF